MNEIWNMAKTPEFWFATVTVGVLINFGTALFFRWFDQFWPRWTSKRRMARIEEEKSRDTLAQQVKGSGLDIIYKQSVGVEMKVDANMFFIFALACLTVCQSYGFNWVSLSYVICGLTCVRTGLFFRKRGNRLIDIARRACYEAPKERVERDADHDGSQDLKNIDEGHVD